MKLTRILSLLVVLAFVLAVVPMASAQLGSSDNSSFTVQNIDPSATAQVTVHFYDETGKQFTPTTLNANKPNPFSLTPGQSFEVYVPGIPAAQLPSGRYSVVIESTAQVVAIANLIGAGSTNFNGSYSGFSGNDGAPSYYLPAVVFNYYGWYSMISVQNTGSGPTDITVSIKCQDGTTGTLSAPGVPAGSSHTFVLKDPAQRPTGFIAATSCNGSATVSSTGSVPIVAIDNQSVPAAGNTQSYNGVFDGASTLYVPALYTAYFGWNASLNVQKIQSGSTTVTISFSDGTPSATCNLTDAQPGCLKYMPSVHPNSGYFGARISSNNGIKLVAVVNAANGVQAQTYNAVSTATSTVGIPSVMKNYYGWNTSFTCQNISSTPTTLHIAYDNNKSYNTTKTLNQGDTDEIFQPKDITSVTTYQGGVIVSAVASGASISCIVNFNNPGNMSNAATKGDWSMSYNAFNR